MSKSQWDEKRIEDLLKQMPPIIDSRHSHELYMKIEKKLFKKKRTVWVLPGLASIAAVLIIVLLIPNFLDTQEFAEHSKLVEDREEIVENDTLKFSEDKKQEMLLNTTVELEKTAVYKEDIVGKELFVFGIPDKNAQNIAQIGIVVERDRDKTWLEQFNDIMPMLTEEAWGLSDYYPLNGHLTLNDNETQINLDVPVTHTYGMGSASEMMFQNTLIASFLFRREIEKITFSTENTPGIMLGNGAINEIDLNAYRKKAHAYFLLEVIGKKHPLLVPSEEPVDTLEAAFSAMRHDIPTHGLKPSIPEDLRIAELTPDNDTIIITFHKGTKVKQTRDMVYTLEAMLLTAKEFGYQKVVIRNVDAAYIGSFRLDQPIEVPLAANKTIFQ